MQAEFKILGQVSLVSSPQQNNKKGTYQYMSANSSWGTAQQPLDQCSPDTNPAHFYLWGHLNTLEHSASIKNKQTLHQHIFIICQTIRNRPGPLKGKDSPWSIGVEEVLIIFCLIVPW